MTKSELILKYLKQLYLDRCFDNVTVTPGNPGFYEQSVCKVADALTEDTKFISEGFIDSLGLVTLRSWLEQEFKVDLPDELVTVKTFGTVKDIVNMLELVEKS